MSTTLSTPASTTELSVADAAGGGAVHVRWRHQRFYWAVLPVEAAPSSLKRIASAHSRAWLDGAFAPYVPRDIDRVASAYTRLPSGRVLACGVPVEALESLLASGAETLTPESIPEWLDEVADPHTLNVLIAAHEPPAVTSLRRRRSGLIAASIAVASILAAVGFQRGAAADRHTLAETSDLLQGLAETSSGKDYLSGIANTVLDDGRVAFELSRLRVTRNSAVRAGLADAVPMLEPVLARWPRKVRTQVQSLTATSSQLSMNVLLPTHEDADTLVAALKATKGVEAAQPQISTGNKGVTLQFTLKSAASGTKPGGTP